MQLMRVSTITTVVQLVVASVGACESERVSVSESLSMQLDTSVMQAFARWEETIGEPLTYCIAPSKFSCST